MLEDLDDKRQKELLLVSNMIVTIEYLPEIMKKLKETNKDKEIDEIITRIIDNAGIPLSSFDITRIRSILKSASIKGREYKEYKFKVLNRYKKEHQMRGKTYRFISQVELFFAINKTLIRTLYVRKRNGTAEVDEAAKKPISMAKKRVIDEYIDSIFSQKDKEIARREK